MQAKFWMWFQRFRFQRSFCTKITAHQQAVMGRGLPKRAPIPGVDNVVVVASGKGGVGKSTVAVNLAVTLALMGKRVGLLDGDIFGPSLPLMMNLHEEPLVDEMNQIIPPINFGVKCLSMGLLVKNDDAIIWRGPLVMSALQRLLKGAVWGPLDILVVDTPPGTGDVHISLSQNIPISGVLLVSTTQRAALEVTLRGAQMYKKLHVPILGLVGNMSHVICNKCQSRLGIFHKHQDENLEVEMQTRVLTTLPLDNAIAECCDNGQPMVVRYRDSEYAKNFRKLAEVVIEELKTAKKI